MDKQQIAEIIRRRVKLEVENLMNGREPNEVMFNTTGCFDTGPHCDGWGHVKVKMTAELNP